MFSPVDRSESALGIIIQTERFREKDRLVTLLSPALGCVKVLVYGAQKSIKAIKAPLYTEGTFVIYHNPERNTRSLTDVTIISMHENLSQSLETSFAAALFSELILLQRGEDAAGYYGLLTEAIDVIDDENYERVAAQFILRYLDISGLGTDFVSCPSCQREYTKEEILGFSSQLNVPCCQSCDTMSKGFILPPSARAYLRDSLRCELGHALTFRISDEMAHRILRYLVRYASFALGCELKSVKSGLLDSLR